MRLVGYLPSHIQRAHGIIIMVLLIISYWLYLKHLLLNTIFTSYRLEVLFRCIHNGNPVFSHAENKMKRELEEIENLLKFHRESLQQVCHSQLLTWFAVGFLLLSLFYLFFCKNGNRLVLILGFLVYLFLLNM